LHLYNTLNRSKEPFEPIDSTRVRLYACGPTVYDHAHIGNARPIIVFDLLFRLLRHIYGADHVVYARNITDIDDKINNRAKEEGVPIADVTARTTKQFHEDIAQLGVLEPSVEPRATGHVEQMIAMTETLIERGHAYAAEGHVLFDVPSMADYGNLARRSLKEMLAGARVDVAPYKRDPMDFVLWKPSSDDQPGWDSPWGRGRPGWHIECSAMAKQHLGEVFDIHGGGIDLTFPHHENELAQSRCAHGTELMAKVWMHNGYLQVEGQKMSKSLGNFLTIHELLEKWPGEVLRLQMLMTHYRQPLDWTDQRCREAQVMLDRWYALAGDATSDEAPPSSVVAPLLDDLNTPGAITEMHRLADDVHAGRATPSAFKAAANFLGLMQLTREEWSGWRPADTQIDEAQVDELIAARTAARAAKDFAEADRLRDQLADLGVTIKDGPDGTSWEVAR
jgi:cysteinyl-tRNA synthetase